MDKSKKKITKKASLMFIAILSLVIVVLLILKYQVEGEQNMPFNLSKIMIISSAEGIDNEDSENTWNLRLIQNNDIYIEFEKNKNYKDVEIIDKIILSNFKVLKSPQVGNLNLYRTSTSESKTYENKEEFKVNDTIEYLGNTESNVKDLKISNQGGMLLFRYSIENLGTYVSQDETEIRHDGTLLSKINITDEQLESEVSFDITIFLVSGISYKGNVTIKLPSGNITKEGTSSKEITDFKDVVFRRVV